MYKPLSPNEKKYFKKFIFDLTGLKITFQKNKPTSFYWTTYKGQISFFNLNIIDLEQYHKKILKRGYAINDRLTFITQVLLHEVAHCRQFMKYKNKVSGLKQYWEKNKIKLEKIADRYALIWYKKFLIKYKQGRC